MPKIIYTPEKIKFLKSIYKGRHILEITKLFNKQFRIRLSPASIKTAAKRHGLKSGYRHIPTHNKKYFEVHFNYLRKIVSGRHYHEVCKLFYKKFGYKLDPKWMASLCAQNGITNGIDSRFFTGQVSHNKGKKGYYAPGSEKGWFKKGHVSSNWRPVGSERIDADGYIYIKVSDTAMPVQRRWKQKHLVIWEELNGPVPKSHNVVFLDSNKMNLSPNNLMLVSRKVHYVMCRLGLYTKDRELTRANILMYSIKGKNLELKRQTLTVIKCKEIVFLNFGGYKVYVVKDGNKFYPVRETKDGEIKRLRSIKLKPRATRKEAQQDLFEYAQFYGWQRI